MSRLNKFTSYLPHAFLYLIAIALSCKSLREPDLWWQLRTGQWILENHRIPHSDLFSFTFSGHEWINVKWGFEALAALLSACSGPESIFILQMAVSAGLVFFLLRFNRAFQWQEVNKPAVILALTITLFTIEYRMIGRPEMFSHLLTVIYLFLLLRFRRNPDRLIFLLVPLQLIWTNLHEGYGTGIVIAGIFTVSAWIEWKLFSKEKNLPLIASAKRLSIVLLLMLGTLVLNPNGIKLALQPLHLFGQLQENKYTTELFNYSTAGFWIWNTYLLVVVIGLSAIGLWLTWKTRPSKQSRASFLYEKFGIAYPVTMVAFIFLASTAYRNLVFLSLLLFPLLVNSFDQILHMLKWKPDRMRQLSLLFLVLQIICYAGIVSNKFYELTKSRDRFGMEVLSVSNPVGAADFILHEHLKGKCFSDYLTSSYLLWKLQPEFKTYIDLRDLDIFPVEFFSEFAAQATFPDEFDALDSIQRFQYVVLYRPQFTALHRHLFNDSRFKLAFADPVAAVYVPKGKADSSVFSFQNPQAVPVSALCQTVNHLLNPWYNRYDYNSVNNDYLAGAFALSLGSLNDAERYARKATAFKQESEKGNELFGEVCYNRALAESAAPGRDSLFALAISSFHLAQEKNPAFAQAYHGLGAVFFQQGKIKSALEQFEFCIDRDASNLNAHLFAAECCKSLINLNNSESAEYTQEAIRHYLSANQLNPDNPTILLNLGFLYYKTADCANTKKYLSRVVDYPELDEHERNSAKQCLSSCAN